MRKLFLLLAVLAFSLSLMAQDKVAVFGGYQYTHLGSDLGSADLNGWDASATYKVTKHFGVTGDVSGAYATIGGISGHLYTYTGGPVVTANAGGKVQPFVHALVGGFNLGGGGSSVNGFTTMLGGGVDWKLNKAFSLRLAQVDWAYYHANGNSASNNVKVASGIVVHF